MSKPYLSTPVMLAKVIAAPRRGSGIPLTGQLSVLVDHARRWRWREWDIVSETTAFAVAA
jgi:hypothetical protein